MKKYFIIPLFGLLITLSSLAQEGMWMFSQLKQLNLEEKGLKIPVEKVYDAGNPSLADAILLLGGGTASFVSPEGLVVTNHHVAYTALQRASSESNNYLTDGFLARERSAEIEAPGYEARLMTAMKDVTDEILTQVEGITDPVEKEKKVNSLIAEISASVEKEGSDLETEIVAMYNGKQYVMYTYKVFRDIRIVYAPPLAIGNYGGEIDNWMWPRHTGDFSFVRVYVSPEGKGDPYSKDNVPYKPEVWLRVSERDLDEGDFNFIMGYPGSSTRYRTSNSVRWNLNYSYPFYVENYDDIISIINETTANDPAGELKMASLEKGLANSMKNYQGNIDGMNRTHFLEYKIEFENEFMSWVSSQPERQSKYGDILQKIEEQYDIIEKTKDRDNVFSLFQGLSGTMLYIAGEIYSIAREMDKPPEERLPGLNEQVLQETAETFVYDYNDFYEPADKALLLRTLRMAESLPSGQRITPLDDFFSAAGLSAEEFVEEAYSTTKLKDLEWAKSLVGKSSSDLEESGDPFLMLAMELYPLSEEIAGVTNIFAANVIALRKQYIDALYEWRGTDIYPDANRTIRFTWGPVKGYSPADAVWYDPFTSLTGMLEKNSGEEPFNAPPALAELEEAKEFSRWADPDMEDIPVAFLNQCDITGGNSGSPVMNAWGEIIGIAFDGNYEAMISDWKYDYDLQRCIAVDMRYVVFITEMFSNAGFLLEEMGLQE